jgi:hypothetical protein
MVNTMLLPTVGVALLLVFVKDRSATVPPLLLAVTVLFAVIPFSLVVVVTVAVAVLEPVPGWV